MRRHGGHGRGGGGKVQGIGRIPSHKLGNRQVL